MPRKLKQDEHQINKVKSMKAIVETPALIPVTFKNKAIDLDNLYSLEWIKKSYQPHLEIF